jgi:hypothetical protein
MSEGGSEAAAQVDDEEDVTEPREDRGELPFPIAVFDAIVASHANAVLRVKSLRDAFDKSLTFLVAIAIAVLKDRNGGALPAAAQSLIGKVNSGPVSMGAWFQLACGLAALLPEDANDGLSRSVRILLTKSGERSEIASEIETLVIPDRNDFAHGITGAEEAVAADEAQLRDLWLRFEQGLAALRNAPLVSFAGIVSHDPEAGTARYSVRALQGNPSHFPIRERTVRGKLEQGWGYIMQGDKPLSLAPLVSCSLNEQAGKPDVYLARALELRSGKTFSAISLSGSGEKKVKVP